MNMVQGTLETFATFSSRQIVLFASETSKNATIMVAINHPEPVALLPLGEEEEAELSSVH